MKSQGFTAIEIVVTIAVVVILGGVGLVAYNNFAAPKPSQESHAHGSSEIDTHDHDMNTMSEVKTTKDLDEASNSLDDASFDNDGLSEMDRQAAEF